MKQYLEAGKFVTTHGVHGELRVYSWSDSPDVLCGAQNLFLDAAGKKRLEIERARVHKNLVVLKLKEVDSVEAARRFIDKTLYINRSDIKLKPGQHFIVDLIGMRVVDDYDGREYGTLREVTNNGAHDIYHIQMTKGEIGLIPAVKPFLAGVDAENQVIKIRPIRGMLDDAD